MSGRYPQFQTFPHASIAFQSPLQTRVAFPSFEAYSSFVFVAVAVCCRPFFASCCFPCCHFVDASWVSSFSFPPREYQNEQRGQLAFRQTSFPTLAFQLLLQEWVPVERLELAKVLFQQWPFPFPSSAAAGFSLEATTFFVSSTTASSKTGAGTAGSSTAGLAAPVGVGGRSPLPSPGKANSCSSRYASNRFTKSPLRPSVDSPRSFKASRSSETDENDETCVE